MTLTQEEKDQYRAYAENRIFAIRVLMEAGFTREEAMMLMTVPQVTVQSTPEISQLAERATALFTKQLAETDE